MSKSAFKIARLEELLKARAETKQKKAAEVAQVAEVTTLEQEACPDKPTKNILEQGSKPMPESLRGISSLDLKLLYTDNAMSESELKWYNSRAPWLYPRHPPGPLF